LEYFQIILLAVIQGLTEFLPVSSSAHLILPFNLFGWPDQGLAFDTAVHLGSLIAIMWYFRADLVSLLRASHQHVLGSPSTESWFAVNLLIASLPIMFVGLAMKNFLESDLRNIDIIILTTVLFGALLLLADRFSKPEKESTALNYGDALMIGLAQCFALIPGTSRSGVTITLALLLGYTRESATRISFLLSIPAIAGAATLKTYDLLQAGMSVNWLNLIVGLVVSFVCAYTCIVLFLGYINRIGFVPFVLYRFALGAVLFWLVR